MVRKYFTPGAVRVVNYNLNRIPNRIRFIRSMCECPSGQRTVGVCAHRTAALQFLRDLFNGRRVPEPNPISERRGNMQTNVEGKHQFMMPEFWQKNRQ